MSEYHLSEQNYTECYFQTLEMAKSDEDYDVDICSTPPSIFSWKLVKRRQRPHRRYTVSSPPAPPSTPTSLLASSSPTPSPTAFSKSSSAVDEDDISNLLYIIDYAPKYKKKLQEQLRIDNELSDLLNVISITNKGSDSSKSSKLVPERGISNASRVIRKQDASTKIFKIHRNPKEFFRDPDEENSLSAPEYDTEPEGTRNRRLARLKNSRRMLTRRQRRFARFQHEERMEDMLDTFDAAMTFNDGEL